MSVVIPVYERRHCVVEAVESVLAQTYPHVECVIVDDGSADGSYDAVVSRWADDPRLRIDRIEHRGVSAARNRALELATGGLVTFLDSDDVMYPHRIERQLAATAERGCDGVFCRVESMSVDGAPLPHWFEDRPDSILDHAWVTMLVPLDAVRSAGGFDEALTIGEDIELLLRLREAGLRIEAIDDVLTVRRYFGDNLTYGVQRGESAMRDAIRRHVARGRALGA